MELLASVLKIMIPFKAWPVSSSFLNAESQQATKCVSYFVVFVVTGGFVVNVVWLMVFKEAYHGLYEAIPGFIAGMLFTFGVSKLTYRGAT